MEGFSVSDANLVVYVHPSKCNKVTQAILRELSSMLFKYNEVFDGVVLSYEINSLDKTAKVLPGIHPYFGVKLKAKVLLFSLKPDMLLEGKVMKITQDSIHVIVLGFASAVINAQDIRQEFKYKIKRGEERFTSGLNKRHSIKVGTTLRFLVKRIDEEILHISGSLLPSHTGCVNMLDKNSEDVPLADQSKTKRDREGETKSHDHASVGTKVDQVKKSKKHKT
jgi:DNA-directed RNA polymerase subunit E'/Rpb7